MLYVLQLSYPHGDAFIWGITEAEKRLIERICEQHLPLPLIRGERMFSVDDARPVIIAPESSDFAIRNARRKT